jgi:hypothetical protein
MERAGGLRLRDAFRVVSAWTELVLVVWGCDLVVFVCVVLVVFVLVFVFLSV